MPNPYNNVEITPEEITSLNEEPQEEVGTPKEEETTASQNEATTEEPSQEVSDTEVEDSFNGLEIDGERFDLDTINQWREDSSNKQSWQKSNTSKSQELSKWNKLVEKINTDEEFSDYMKDYFYDNPEEVKKLGLDGSIEVDDIPTDLDPEDNVVESDSRMDEIQERLDGFEVDKMVAELDHELTELVEKNSEYFQNETDELDFLAYVDDNKVGDLEVGFRLWSFDQMQDQLDHYKKLDNNKSRNAGKVISREQKGAMDEKSDTPLKGWKDVSINNPEIAKYFE